VTLRHGHKRGDQGAAPPKLWLNLNDWVKTSQLRLEDRRLAIKILPSCSNVVWLTFDSSKA
jgi:hypothetical protein